MKKARIIKRTNPIGEVEFVIQQRFFIFFWIWVDAWLNNGIDTVFEFKTLNEAEDSLWKFDGSKYTEEIVK